MTIKWPRVALVAVLAGFALGALALGAPDTIVTGVGILLASLVKVPVERKPE